LNRLIFPHPETRLAAKNTTAISRLMRKKYSSRIVSKKHRNSFKMNPILWRDGAITQAFEMVRLLASLILKNL